MKCWYIGLSIFLVVHVAQAVELYNLNIKVAEACNFKNEKITKINYEKNNKGLLQLFHIDENNYKTVIFESDNTNTQDLKGFFLLSNNIAYPIGTWLTVTEVINENSFSHMIYLPLGKEIKIQDLGLSPSLFEIDGIYYSRDRKVYVLNVFEKNRKSQKDLDLLEIEKKLLSKCGGFKSLPDWYTPGSVY